MYLPCLSSSTRPASRRTDRSVSYTHLDVYKRQTENCTMCDNGGGGSKRQEVKILLRRLRRDNPNIERSIFNSIHAVNLDMMPGYKTGGVLHSFLDDYDERGKKSE